MSKFCSFLLFSLALCLPFCGFAQQLGRTADKQNYVAARDLSSQAGVKWKFNTGGKVFASPVVAGKLLLLGSENGKLYALNKDSGKERWQFATTGPVHSSVAVDGDKVFFLSADGMFYAVQLSDGKLLWQFKTGGEQFFDAWDYLLSSPAVYEGVVYFGSGDSHVYALDAASGALRWKYKTGKIVHASPTVTEEGVYIGSFDGYFYALDHQGSLRWKFDTMGERFFPVGEIQYHAAVDDSTVYFCARDFNIYALNRKTGKGHWVYHELGSWPSVPTVQKQQLLVSTSDTHRILSLSGKRGSRNWATEVGLNIFGSIATTDSMAYVGSLDGKLHQINLRTGEKVFTFQTEASKDKYDHFFDPKTQKLRTNLMDLYKGDYLGMYEGFLGLGSILSTPWIEDGRVYFGAADGYVYALE